MEKITGLRQADFDPAEGCQAFVDACENLWGGFDAETKITLWNEHKEQYPN